MLTTTLLIGFAWIIYLCWAKRCNRNVINKIPGPPQHLFFGSMYQFMSSTDNIWNTIRLWSKTYHPIYKYWIINEPVVNLLDPNDVEIVLSSTTHSTKSKIYDILHSWLGTGLLTSAGTKWHNRRKILTPAFHFSILQEFLKVFIDQSELLVKQLEDEVDKSCTDVTPIVSQFTLHSICETAMGTRLDQNATSREYRKSIFRIGEIIVFRLTRPWLVSNLGFFFSALRKEQSKVIKILHEFTNNIIQKRQLDLETPLSTDKKKRRLAMLDLLISAKTRSQLIDDQGIREEVDTFMFEGHDTTAACISFTLLALACHTTIQEKVYQEIEQVLDLKERVTYDHLQKLNYLEQVIRESLRLFPSVPFISRVSDENIQTKSGYVVPKDTIIQIHIYDIHRNPKIFENPNVFDPDRFSNDNMQRRHPFAYIPFSAGPRNCIGQKFAMLEIKSAISAIVKNYIIKPVDTYDDLTIVANLVLKSKNGIKMKFCKRTNK